jgi:hypothetical protein
MFAGLLPCQEVIAQAENTLVILTEIRAYEQGCVFEISGAVRRGNDPPQSWIGAGSHPIVGLDHPVRPGDVVPDSMLRFGVQYGTGSKATTTNHPRWHPDREPPAMSPPVLTSAGGGGSTAVPDLVTFSRPLWLWPLPPAEWFDLVTEWPIAGIALTRHQIDGARIVVAAHHSRPYWSVIS